MIQKIVLAYTLLMLFAPISAQNCHHNNLSTQFDFSLTKNQIPHESKIVDSVEITVSIYNKDMRVLTQAVKVGSNYLLPTVFTNCAQVRSFQTNVNSDKQFVNNDYGDFVVADFNFDEMDDFAIKIDSRINGGPSYAYYLQDEKNWFVKDEFLSTEMKIFPSGRNSKKKLLTTRVLLDNNKYLEKSYKRISKTNSWKLKKETVVAY